MTHDHDLKDYRASDLGAFQMLTPEQCVCALCALVGVVIIFWPWTL